MVTTSQTPPQPFTLVIGDDPVYSLDTDRRRIGIGTRLPQRRLHLVTPDAVVARFESTGAASPQVEFRGSGGSGTLSYNSATGQWVLGTDLEATDSELAVDVLSVPDGGPTAARIAVGTGDDIKVYHTGTTGYFRNETGSLHFLAGAGGSIAAVQIASTGAVTCSKGITVNTTAASSALVVDDATGSLGIGQAASSGRKLDVRVASGTAIARVMSNDAAGSSKLELIPANTYSKRFEVEVGTSGAANLYANGAVAVVISSAQVASFARGLVPPVVADATAESALTATAGALCFRTDTSKHRGYNGSAWVDLY